LGTQNNARLNLIESRKIYLIDNRNNLDYAVYTWQGDAVIERDLTQQLKLLLEVYGIASENTFEINNDPRAVTNLVNIATTAHH